VYQKLTKTHPLPYVIFLLLFISACSSMNTTKSDDKLTLQTARYAHAAATDGKLIYVFAGSQGGTFLNDIEIINPQTGEVEVLQDLLIPRRYFSAVWDGQHSIYLIGGISLTEGILRVENRVEVFNLLTGQITFAKPLPQATRNSRSVFIDGRIYVFGGGIKNPSGGNKLASTSLSAVHDIASNRWIKLADMPTAKSTAAVSKDGLIYVVGGFNHQVALDVFERYDPKTNQWQTLAPVPQNISAHSATIVGNKMLLFGDYARLDSTLAYDFHKKSWTETKLGFQGSRHNTSVTIGNTVYVIGGNINSKGVSLDAIQQFSL
jgi:hypothetical protein